MKKIEDVTKKIIELVEPNVRKGSSEKYFHNTMLAFQRQLSYIAPEDKERSEAWDKLNDTVFKFIPAITETTPEWKKEIIKEIS